MSKKVTPRRPNERVFTFFQWARRIFFASSLRSRRERSAVDIDRASFREMFLPASRKSRPLVSPATGSQAKMTSVCEKNKPVLKSAPIERIDLPERFAELLTSSSKKQIDGSRPRRMLPQRDLFAEKANSGRPRPRSSTGSRHFAGFCSSSSWTPNSRATHRR